jgi:nucleotide-binding universal stress UspA family protein
MRASVETIVWAVDPALSLPSLPARQERALGHQDWTFHSPFRKERGKKGTLLEEDPSETFQHLAAWALHRFVARLRAPVRVIPLTAWESSASLAELAILGSEASSFPSSSFPGRGNAAMRSPAEHAALLNQLRASFGEVTERVRIPGMLPLEITEDPALPSRLRAELFLERCRSLDADLIFMASRGQSGPRRWLGGSFAETVSAVSGIPCLIMNPLWNRLTDYRSFSFATGLSKNSLATFERLCPWLAALNSRVRLLHFSGPSHPATSTPPVDPKTFLEAAGKYRVEARFDEQEEGLEQLIPTLLQEAEESGGFIGLDAPPPSLRRALRGSPLKRLIRSARAPILTACGAALAPRFELEETPEGVPVPGAA